MASYKPLVFENDPTVVSLPPQPLVQRLQAGDGLDIPLNNDVAALATDFAALVLYLSEAGFNLPPELLEKYLPLL